MAGDGVVSGVEEEFGQELQKGYGGGPRSAEVLKDEEGCVGAGEHEFVCVFRFWIDDDVDGIEIAGIEVVAGEDAGGEWALQRCETEDGMAVAAKDELNEAVAESADAVVEEDVRHVTGARRIKRMERKPEVRILNFS